MKRSEKTLTIILLLVVVSLVTTVVQAQTTSISNLNAPSTATVGSVISVSVVVTYSGNNGYYMRVYIYDTDAAALVTGTPESPDCASRQGTNEANSAICVLLPQFVAGYSGSIAVTFVLTFSTPKVYDLYAGADFASASGASGGQIVSGSFSQKDFSIVVSATDQSAVGTTSISNLSYPADVVLSDSSVVVDVSFTASYTSWPTGYGLQLSIFNATLASEYPSGYVVSSSPLTCQEFASMPESTTCGVASTTQASGSEFVEFALTLPSAGTYTTLAATALFYRNGQILSGSFSMKYLTITVTSPNSSPSTSVQMPQTLQSTNSNPPPSNSDNSALIGIGLLAVIVVVLGAIIVHERRIHQKSPETQPEQVRSTPKVEIPKAATSQTPSVGAPASLFCIECGTELQLGSKYCNRCGTKQ